LTMASAAVLPALNGTVRILMFEEMWWMHEKAQPEREDSKKEQQRCFIRRIRIDVFLARSM
jgi:hypothetical protein